ACSRSRAARPTSRTSSSPSTGSAMLRSVLAASLRQVRRSFAWWSLGLAALVALLAAVYPSVRESPELDELVERYPDALKGFFSFGGELDFLSPAGFLGSELFSF